MNSLATAGAAIVGKDEGLPSERQANSNSRVTAIQEKGIIGGTLIAFITWIIGSKFTSRRGFLPFIWSLNRRANKGQKSGRNPDGAIRVGGSCFI
jgi:hypothetical protein